MKKLIAIIFVTYVFLSTYNNVYAQQTTIPLSKASNQYSASGSVVITKNNTEFSYSATMKDLPVTLPANGVYYILWALTPENKADNLGPVTNTTQNNGTLSTKVKQFFVTSEKERYPEFVTGPRIAQSATIADSVFSGITTATAAPTTKASAIATVKASTPPVGGPVGAPETGLGGTILWNGMIYSLGAIGLSGLSISLYNKLKNK